MKKSKIILPALGLLLLSTTASVTGTVAWFTSVSTVNSGLSSFAVKRVGGNLALEVKTAADNSGNTVYGVGTQLSGDSVIYAANSFLTHGSYNHLNHKVGKPSNGAASAFTTFADSTADAATGSGENITPSPWCIEGADSNKYYYAVTWTYIFTYTYGSDETNVNLYFDVDSTITPTVADNSKALQTYKGFRMAFVSGSALGEDDLRNVVWAKNQTAANCKYIQDNTTVSITNDVPTYTNAGAYTPTSSNYDLIDSTNNNLTQIGESSTGAATRADYLGQFNRADAADVDDTIYVKVVAWYEGTDENVVNAASLDTVAAALSFYTRTAAAADTEHDV